MYRLEMDNILFMVDREDREGTESTSCNVAKPMSDTMCSCFQLLLPKTLIWNANNLAVLIHLKRLLLI